VVKRQSLVHRVGPLLQGREPFPVAGGLGYEPGYCLGVRLVGCGIRQFLLPAGCFRFAAWKPGLGKIRSMICAIGPEWFRVGDDGVDPNHPGPPAASMR
jgi:hypothetical protein